MECPSLERLRTSPGSYSKMSASRPAASSGPGDFMTRSYWSALRCARWRRRAADALAHPAEVRRNGRRVRGRVGRQEHRRARRLVEVEVLVHVAQNLLVLADVGSRVGTAICRGVQSRTAEEVVLNELEVGIAAEDLMVDVAVL